MEEQSGSKHNYLLDEGSWNMDAADLGPGFDVVDNAALDTSFC